MNFLTKPRTPFKLLLINPFSVPDTLGYPPKKFASRFIESGHFGVNFDPKMATKGPKNENFDKSFYGERFGPHSDHLTP